MSNVVPMQTPKEEPGNLTRTMARAKTRELARNSSSVAFTSHLKVRMKERNISSKQIMNCLMCGHVPEWPFKNNHGNWQFNMLHTTCGVQLDVGVAIDWPSGLIILTAYDS